MRSRLNSHEAALLSNLDAFDRQRGAMPGRPLDPMDVVGGLVGGLGKILTFAAECVQKLAQDNDQPPGPGM